MFYIPWVSGFDRQFIQLTSGGNLHSRRTDGGNDIDEASASWDIDTSRHTVAVERFQDINGNRNAGVEFFYDGASVDVNTNSYIPDVSNYPELRIGSGWDVDAHVHTIKATKPFDQTN